MPFRGNRNCVRAIAASVRAIIIIGGITMKGSYG